MESPADRQSAVAKAGLLLQAFRGPDRVLGVSELARRSGLWKSTAHRLLSELESIGFVEREGSGYRLGLELFELGVRVGAYRPGGLRDIAIGELSKLHVASGQIANLATLEGTEIVYLEKIHTPSAPQLKRPVTSPGVRLPASCSALGKAMLAHSAPEVVGDVFRQGLTRRTVYSITEPGRLMRELDTIRRVGYAREHEEMAIGAVAVAAPILAHGMAIAAVSLAGPALRVNWDRNADLVRASARKISAMLSRTGADESADREFTEAVEALPRSATPGK